MQEALQAFRTTLRLPANGRQIAFADFRRRLGPDPGSEAVLEASLAWLFAAQDRSASRDGGVARHYNLLRGWGTSYPETTGYIVPTLLALAQRGGPQADACRMRAECMLDWLCAIQFPDGGFQGGRIDSWPRVPVTFNTGQILLGLAAGAAQFPGRYREPMCRAADWLVATQDADGCWRRHPTPFAAPGEKAYETHVAWGLMEAARCDPDRGYGEAALRNVRWALHWQRPNGWFGHCCLSDPARPLTHTLGYVLRGIVEAYRMSEEQEFLAGACRTADALLSKLEPDGFLAGRFDAAWRPAVRWSCLTGTVQIAACWLLLADITGESRYRTAARQANSYVRRTVALSGPEGIRGGVQGSYPIYGGYCSFEYPNWAAKFLIDALLLERQPD